MTVEWLPDDPRLYRQGIKEVAMVSEDAAIADSILQTQEIAALAASHDWQGVMEASLVLAYTALDMLQQRREYEQASEEGV